MTAARVRLCPDRACSHDWHSQTGGSLRCPTRWVGESPARHHLARWAVLCGRLSRRRPSRVGAASGGGPHSRRTRVVPQAERRGGGGHRLRHGQQSRARGGSRSGSGRRPASNQRASPDRNRRARRRTGIGDLDGGRRNRQPGCGRWGWPRSSTQVRRSITIAKSASTNISPGCHLSGRTTVGRYAFLSERGQSRCRTP